MPIVEILAGLSGALRLANAFAEAAQTLNSGQPLSGEQIQRIQSAKKASEQTWEEALERLRSGPQS